MTAAIALVLGGARSGKSRRAEAIALASGLERVYVATAEARDEEMETRILEHRARRGQGWITVEAPFELGAAVAAESRPDRVLVVDCLTLWLSNILLSGRHLRTEEDELLAKIAAAAGPIVLVSNEVGTGVVPDSPLGRTFRDAQGRLNQRVAAVATAVELVVAGLPLTLKPQAA